MDTPSGWPVCLAVLSADPRARTATDTSTMICHCHHLAKNLIVVIQPNEIAVFCQTLERHHIAPAHFEASSATDAGLGINRQ
jgi:hypothetical protein